MFGMELYELFSFLRQGGLALAGAASLWGFVFLWMARGKKEKQEFLQWAAHRLLLAFSLAFAVASVSWFVLWNIWPALAHEGITLFPIDAEYKQAFSMTLPLYLSWIVFTLAALLLYKIKKRAFLQHLSWFYGLQFLVISVLIALYAWTGNPFSKEQLFIYFHGFHSIFTLGTVLTLDFLFLSTRLLPEKQLHIFPFFPVISKIIFIGLGLDFLSALLVFEEVVDFSTRFFTAQTVVGILIINGVFMAGPLTRKILNGLEQGKLLMGGWRFVAGISGAISVVSWLTITFIDYFPRATLSYAQLIGIYAMFVLFAIAVNTAIALSDAEKVKQITTKEVVAK